MQLKFLKNLYTNSKFREIRNITAVEGLHLIKKLIPYNIVSEVYYEKFISNEFKSYLKFNNISYFQLPLSEIRPITDGVVGICRFQNASITINKIKNNSLICDNIRNPSNLALIFNSASTLNFNNIFLTKGCVDAWNPKVVNESKGAIFSVNIQQNLSWEEISEYTTDMSLFLAESNLKQTLDQFRINLTGGSNDNTLSDGVTSNVIRPKISQERIFYYDEINYSKYKNIALVIGGETEGLSKEAFCALTKNKGLRINIPTTNTFGCLNAGIAASVILYEMQRKH